MELIITLIVLIIVFSIGFLVGNKQLLKKESEYTEMWHDPNFKQEQLFPTSSVDTMGTIGSKPKTQTDYQNEHKAEEENGDIDFMHKWIQEKSGKKKSNPKQFDGVKSDVPFVKTKKRKPKTTKEWEDEFDIGGNS